MADEHSVQKRVIEALKANDRCIPLRVTNITGMPDVVACVGGAFAAIEVKDDKRGPYGVTKGQRIRLAKVRRCGGVACVVDKNNIEGFAAFLNETVAAEDPRGMCYGLD